MLRFGWVLATALLLAAAPQTALAQTACRTSGSFERWLEDFKREALTKGVSQQTLSVAAPYMTYSQEVVNRDRGQRVFSQTFFEFSDRMVAKYRIDGGIAKIRQNQA